MISHLGTSESYNSIVEFSTPILFLLAESYEMNCLVFKIHAVYKKGKVKKCLSEPEPCDDVVKYVSSRWYCKVKCKSLSYTYFTIYKP